jgi:hypothetical protein
MTTVMNMHQAALKLLRDPLGFPDQAPLPAVAMPCFMALLALVLSGLAFAAGEAVRPAVAGLSLMGAWVILTSALVVACSVSGIACSWREGGRLLALAGMPILFKMTGALVFTIWTTLSPFYFTASPTLFWPSAPFLVQRIDLFEVWSLCLLWVLIRKRSGSTSRRAGIVVTVVWLTLWALAAGFSRLGAG